MAASSKKAAPAKAKGKSAEEERKNVPATRAAAELPTSATGVAVPDYLRGAVERDKGRGLSSSAADNLIPIIYVLQAQSPQVIKRNPEYIEGAEPGMLWLRNAAGGMQLVDGEQGIVVQPCSFAKTWNEWKTRDSGGGFVRSYAWDKLPSQARPGHDARNPDRVFFSMPDGNEIVETRNHVIVIHGGLAGLASVDKALRIPFSLSFSGGGHTSSRQWMSLMNQFAPAPSFSRLYLLKTKFKQNNKGEWYAIEASDHGWVGSETDYLAGRGLNEAFMAGEKTIAEPAAENNSAANDAGV